MCFQESSCMWTGNISNRNRILEKPPVMHNDNIFRLNYSMNYISRMLGAASTQFLQSSKTLIQLIYIYIHIYNYIIYIIYIIAMNLMANVSHLKKT